MTHEFERFPILYGYDELREASRRGWPGSVPYALLAPHEEQAQRNHYQSLKRLRERGGLHPKEMLAVVLNKDYKAVEHLTTEQAISELLRHRGIHNNHL